MSGWLIPFTRSGKILGQRLCAPCSAGMQGFVVETLVAGCVVLYCHSSLEICFSYLWLGWSGWEDYRVVWSDCKVVFGRISSLPLAPLSRERPEKCSQERQVSPDWVFLIALVLVYTEFCFADNTWKGVGLQLGDGYWELAQYLCLLCEGCFQERYYWSSLSVIRAMIMDYLT